MERRIATYIGGKRIPVSGRARGDAADIDHDHLCPEVKYRKKLPAWLFDARAQAEASQTDMKLPVQIYVQRGMPAGEAFIVMRLEHFRSWYL